MILNTFENRLAITKYLELLGEDDFIDEVIIPLFSSQGYYLYRINPHGPGEHGKDLIFYRHVPFFYDDEYLVVQAKAEKLTAQNVEKFSSQIKRALAIPFTAKSGSGDKRGHYAVFINSRKHTCDADFEFQRLIESNPHIKILSQETVCELIMKLGVAPQHLLKDLSVSIAMSKTKNDELVYDTILSNKPREIDDLFDHKLKFLKDGIGTHTKDLVIEYINDRWQMDRSWAGTVKPMKWFDTYFEFFTPNHSKILLSIFDEFRSSTPSFDALPYTKSVINKVTPDLLQPIANEFVSYCANATRSHPRERLDVVIQKLDELCNAKLIADKQLDSLSKKIVLVETKKNKLSKDERTVIYDEIDEFVYGPL